MSTQTDLTELLEQNFNEDELIYLCTDLNIPYESISGDNKKRKALEIVNYMQRRGQLDILVNQVAEERPHLQPQLIAIYPQAFTQTASSPPPKPQQTTTQTANQSSNKTPLLIGGGIILLLVLIFGLWGISNIFSPGPEQTAVPTNGERFLYQVRIQDNDNQPIDNAQVTIDLPGTTPINTYTDSTGLAAFQIDSQYANEIVRLHVEKNGYDSWDQHITITADERPYEIKLTPVP